MPAKVKFCVASRPCLSCTCFGKGKLSMGISLMSLCVAVGADTTEAGSLESLFPADYSRASAEHSGKMRCLKVLLGSIMGQEGPDKVVVVSNSTAALDIIQTLCDQQSYTTVRIDGATDVNKRQDIVNSFNLYGAAQVTTLY